MLRTCPSRAAFAPVVVLMLRTRLGHLWTARCAAVSSASKGAQRRVAEPRRSREPLVTPPVDTARADGRNCLAGGASTGERHPIRGGSGNCRRPSRPPAGRARPCAERAVAGPSRSRPRHTRVHHDGPTELPDWVEQPVPEDGLTPIHHAIGTFVITFKRVEVGLAELHRQFGGDLTYVEADRRGIAALRTDLAGKAHLVPDGNGPQYVAGGNSAGGVDDGHASHPRAVEAGQHRGCLVEPDGALNKPLGLQGACPDELHHPRVVDGRHPVTAQQIELPGDDPPPARSEMAFRRSSAASGQRALGVRMCAHLSRPRTNDGHSMAGCVWHRRLIQSCRASRLCTSSRSPRRVRADQARR